ncbi:class I SAM-dependent methyltransferase [Brevundimonas sp.]|uniref:class I SAM-dependent methyltransferase n=1 Tax=Brevundimonas sp. TaxID=1871086 RepID=UPI002E15DCB9|nr:class I SAM-dependent methyltransferase [Brevundimonas sp.]
MPPPDEGLKPDAAAEEIVDLYARHADAWAEARGDTLLADEAVHLNRFMSSLPVGGEVLDLGCGSGRPIAATLIGRGFRVTGVDASPGLIDLCRAGFPEQAWIVADMRRLDLGRRFDGLLAWCSAFHLTAEDQEAMAAVYARHVAPGGRLMFVGGPRRGVAMGEWMGRPLHHASLDPAEYREGLERAGFDDVQERVLKPDADEGARVWTARRKTSD